MKFWILVRNGCPGRLLLLLLGCRDSHVRLERVSRETAAVSPRLSHASHSRLEPRERATISSRLSDDSQHRLERLSRGRAAVSSRLSDDSHRLSSGEQPRRDRLAKRPVTPPKATPVPRNKRVAAVADDATLPGITPKSGLLAPPRSLESVAEPTHGPEHDASDRRVLVPSGRLYHQPEGTVG